jgi:hypothetical protein
VNCWREVSLGPVPATVACAMATDKEAAKTKKEREPERGTAAEAAENKGRSGVRGAKSGGDQPISKENKRSTKV